MSWGRWGFRVRSLKMRTFAIGALIIFSITTSPGPIFRGMRRWYSLLVLLAIKLLMFNIWILVEGYVIRGIGWRKLVCALTVCHQGFSLERALGVGKRMLGLSFKRVMVCMSDRLLSSHQLPLLWLLALIVRLSEEPVIASPTKSVTCPRYRRISLVVRHKHLIGTAETILQDLRLCFAHLNTESIACGWLSAVLRWVPVALIVWLLWLWRLLNRLCSLIVVICRKLILVDLADAILGLKHELAFTLKLIIRGFIWWSNERRVASLWNISFNRACHTFVQRRMAIAVDF